MLKLCCRRGACPFLIARVSGVYRVPGSRIWPGSEGGIGSYLHALRGKYVSDLIQSRVPVYPGIQSSFPGASGG